MIFDSHAHYDDEAFSEDREALFASLQENGIRRIVNIGSNMASSRTTVTFTEKYPYFYGAVGVHPTETAELTEELFHELQELLKEPKIVALGEIGLDYYWDEPEREIQKTWFERQLLLAKEEDMPVVIHSRDAAKDTLDIMKSSGAKDMSAVIHCFSYGVEMAREYLNMGHYLGVGGVLTFKNAKKLKEVVEYMPMDRMLIETDCPYLAPVPFRGKRNDSRNLTYVIQAISEIKGISEEEVQEITFANANRFYRIGDEL